MTNVALVHDGECFLATRFGEFRLHTFRTAAMGEKVLALVYGTPPFSRPALVRIHSQCLTGDAFGSLRCDCGRQLRQALHYIRDEGEGVLVYQMQEGRGIGLINKLRAYELQDGGLDTVDANLQLGFQADHRTYGVCASVLRHFGIERVRLLSNNPAKIRGLEEEGIPVERVSLISVSSPDSDRYLRTKRDRLGHMFDSPAWDSASGKSGDAVSIEPQPREIVDAVRPSGSTIDVLLAHSFFLKNDPKQITKMRPYPPLGTLYAASVLRQNGFSVDLFDAMLSAGVEEFERLLDERRPRTVVFYEDEFNFLNKMCLNHSRTACIQMTSLSKARGAVVVASGSDVTDNPELYLSAGVDFALLGESEHTLVELLTRLRTGASDAGDTHGLALRDSCGHLRRTPARPPERTPDVFPFPAWDLLEVEKYRRAWTDAHGYFSINMVTTRGCPFHCNWCAKPIWGQRYAMRSPGNVAEEMAEVKKMFAPDHIWFADDIFGLQPKWVREFADEVQARNARVPFTIQTRADLMTEVAVEALAQAGCVEAWLGAESGSQRILNAMEKGTSVEQVMTARGRLKQAGIRACFFIQFGYPGETFDEILETVRLVCQALPDDIGVSVSNPLPGTKFHSMVKAGLGEQDHWQDSDDLAMMFQGTYSTDLYRKLHKILHRNLDKLRASENGCTADLDEEWEQLRAEEWRFRSVKPTRFVEISTQAPAPDLSRRWN